MCAERGAGGRGAGTEWGAVITEIGWSVERLFHRSGSDTELSHV